MGRRARPDGERGSELHAEPRAGLPSERRGAGRGCENEILNGGELRGGENELELGGGENELPADDRRATSNIIFVLPLKLRFVYPFEMNQKLSLCSILANKLFCTQDQNQY